ncbi:CRAL-TRIO domain-containing protein [Tribonema minus]|uniref:CRAL-TRIO domain-containing protein n=1 Tax=Tribonema minus TaxID=303371 RepID=A0A835YZF0_9STRA|nr:CRAL-TRIO domain-containing protein [Tribonema minus]
MSLSEDQHAMIQSTLRQLQEVPVDLFEQAGVSFPPDEALCWRYLDAAGWRECVRSKPISEYIRDTLEWRRNLKVPKLAAETLLSPALQTNLCTGSIYVDGFDASGDHPLVMFRLARFKGTETTEDFIEYMVYNLERALLRVPQEQRALASFCVLFNCDTGDAGQMPRLAAVREAVNVLMRHYPSRLHRLYVVNPGTAFALTWRVVRPLLEANTRNKIVFVRGHGSPNSKRQCLRTTLAQTIDLSTLEVDYGGDRTFDFMQTLPACVHLNHVTEQTEA